MQAVKETKSKSPLWQRILALAVLGLVIILLYSMLIWPAQQQIDKNEARTRNNLLTAEKLSERAGNAELFEQSRRQLDAAIAQSADFIDAGSEAAAFSELQTLVRGLMAKNGIEAQSFETRNIESEGAVKLIGLKVTFVGTYTELLQFLRDVETARPLLMLNGIDIRARPARGVTAAWNTLNVSADVFAMLRPTG